MAIETSAIDASFNENDETGTDARISFNRLVFQLVWLGRLRGFRMHAEGAPEPISGSPNRKSRFTGKSSLPQIDLGLTLGDVLMAAAILIALFNDGPAVARVHDPSDDDAQGGTLTTDDVAVRAVDIRLPGSPDHWEQTDIAIKPGVAADNLILESGYVDAAADFDPINFLHMPAGRVAIVPLRPPRIGSSTPAAPVGGASEPPTAAPMPRPGNLPALLPSASSSQAPGPVSQQPDIANSKAQPIPKTAAPRANQAVPLPQEAQTPPAPTPPVVIAVNPPVENAPIGAQSWIHGDGFSFVVAGSFTDPDGFAMAYTATCADGTPLPSWLAFDPSTQTFSGITPSDSESLSITVTATDTTGRAVKETFLADVIAGPTDNHQTANQTLLANRAISFGPVKDTFSDPNGQTLTYTASAVGGGPIPSWLTFHPDTLTFTGTAPSEAQQVHVVLTAKDTSGLSASETIAVTVIGAPVDELHTASQIWNAGSNVNFALSNGTFADPQGQTLTYSATLAGGAALPGWLAISATTGSFSGTAPASSPALTFIVSAINASGLSASETFSASIIESPFEAHPTTDKAWLAGQAVSVDLTTVFQDPQGEYLTLTVTLADGTTLPSWLTFDPTTRTITGTAPATAETVSFKITATDTSGLTALETFTAVVVGAPVDAIVTSTQAVLENQAFSFALAANTFTDPQREGLTYSATSNGSSLPAWLHFDGATQTFTGLPPLGAANTLVTVQATNSSGMSAFETFDIQTIGSPADAFQTAAQSWVAGDVISFMLPAGTFVDPQGEEMTFTAAQGSGSPLPGWLTFNATTHTFTGTVPNAATTFSIKVSVVDTSGLTNYESYAATIIGAPNDVLATSTQTWDASQAFSFTLPGATFSDPQGETLSYSATLADGSDLPTWLHFNPDTKTFSGTPPSVHETLSLKVTATNSSGLSATETFGVVTIAPPTLDDQTANQTLMENQLFSFTLSTGTFADPQGGGMTYAATLPEGSALPTWLQFDPDTLTFSGTPPNTALNLAVKVTATDTDGLSSSETFHAVLLATPTDVLTTATQIWTANQAFSFTLPGNTFSDPQGEVLTYTAALATGSALPIWLTFNAASDTFSGTAPSDHENLVLKITATNSSGLAATETFCVSTIAPPAIDHQTVDQTLLANQTVSFSFASDTFVDPQGDGMTYSAALANGSSLPAWLHFDSATRMFSGTVPVTAADLTVQVTATDSDGLSTSETFVAHVIGTPVDALTTASQTWLAGETVSFTLPGRTFTDPQDEALTYGVTLADGSALPGWLTFNAATQTFSGTCPNDCENLSLKVTATNSNALSATEIFAAITIATPTDVFTTATQIWTANQAFSFTLPGGTFADPQGELLTYSASLWDGSGLPSWLDFTGATQTFSGTAPSDHASLSIKVVATDSSGLSASETISVGTAAPPECNVQTADQIWRAGEPVSLVLSANTFLDPQSDSMTYTATMSDGSALPGWLTFDSASQTFSGTPTDIPNDMTIRLNATDSEGQSSFEIFHADVLATPTDNLQTAPETWMAGQVVNFALPPGTFTDPRNQILSYTATLSDSGALPSWLTFNTATQTFSGIVPDAATSTFIVTITATNQDGLSASENVTFTTIAAPQSMTFTDGFIAAAQSDPTLLTVTPGALTEIYLHGLTTGGSTLNLNGGPGYIDGIAVTLDCGITKVDATGTTKDVTVTGLDSGNTTVIGASASSFTYVTFSGGGNSFTADGGNNNITTNASSGDNTINLTNAGASPVDSNANDTFTLGAGGTTINGGSSNKDVITGGSGAMNYVDGGGTALIHEGAMSPATVALDRGGTVTVYGNSGDLRLNESSGTATVVGGSGTMEVDLSGGVANITDGTAGLTEITETSGTLNFTGKTGDVSVITTGGSAMLDFTGDANTTNETVQSWGTDTITAALGNLTVISHNGANLTFIGGSGHFGYTSAASGTLNLEADNSTGTLSLGTGANNIALDYNQGANLTINDFNPATCSISLYNDSNNGGAGDVTSASDGASGWNISCGRNVVHLVDVVPDPSAIHVTVSGAGAPF